MCESYVISNRDAATNVPAESPESWQHSPFIRDNYSPRTLADIEAELSMLVENPSAGSEIEWGMRNLVLERVAD